MILSDRRTLLKTAAVGTAALALAPSRQVWAQPADGDRSIESRLTGSVVEIIDLADKELMAELELL